ncbi:MAG: hypothetical protein IPQ13_06650 [Holophagaceae bacterium]|nr:hypothetical protein [Holophagaceae bacterium]
MASFPNTAERHSRIPAAATSGFSLVELMVALLFTGLLMTGMAQVFKSSLTSFYTSGEVLSSARRNRASIDLLYDDLNSAGMYLTSLSAPPSEVAATNPAFYVLPNQAVVPAGGPDDPATADQLLFYLDQPLAFEGSISTAGRSAAEIIGGGGVVATGAGGDSEFQIDCGDPAYANLLSSAVTAAAAQVPPAGLSMVFKDSWETLYFNAATVSGSTVTINAIGDPGVAISGLGSQGTPAKAKHIPGAAVLFYRPSQMVRYSIKMKQLDPQNANGIPCLVRDQGTYAAGAFVADPTQESIITENVSGFKAYLSADSGNTWAGQGAAYTDWASLRADLDTQLVAAGRKDYTTTQGNEHWFRKIPTLVRLDITTRTATKRSEYSANPTTAAYRELVQSLVIVPRHFGLPLN